jgi:hypothetical protein
MSNKPSPCCEPFTERIKGEGGGGGYRYLFHEVSSCLTLQIPNKDCKECTQYYCLVVVHFVNIR